MLALLFVGGLALNLTPCVYPVIPLTLSFFAGQAQGQNRRVFRLALVYVLGMATTYSALGVAAALSGRLFGSALQSPWVLGFVAVVLVALALSMFGLYDLRMPSALMQKAGARSGAAGAYAMGLLVGVVAAPCVGPFVLGLLAFVAARQQAGLGFLFFFVLSLGLGLPYLFLGAFSGSLARLPRAGMWMESVKKVFGWVLLAMAAYFLRPALPGRTGDWSCRESSRPPRSSCSSGRGPPARSPILGSRAVPRGRRVLLSAHDGRRRTRLGALPGFRTGFGGRGPAGHHRVRRRLVRPLPRARREDVLGRPRSRRARAATDCTRPT